jgi:hypothetical protein
MNAEAIEFTDREFENLLNEREGDVDICGMKYPAGTALREIDPTAFDVMQADEPTRWKCGECGEEFDEEADAEECCPPEEEEETNPLKQEVPK